MDKETSRRWNRSTALELIGLLILAGLTMSVSYPSMTSQSPTELSSDPPDLHGQIQHVRNALANIIPRLRAHVEVVAQEQAAIERLRQELSDRKVELDREQANLFSLRAELDNPAGQLKIGGRAASAAEIRTALSAGFDGYVQAKAVYDAKAQILTTRVTQLNEARLKLSKLLGEKKSLELRLDRIEAQLELQAVRRGGLNVGPEREELERCRRIILEIQSDVGSLPRHRATVRERTENPVEDLFDLYFMQAMFNTPHDGSMIAT